MRLILLLLVSLGLTGMTGFFDPDEKDEFEAATIITLGTGSGAIFYCACRYVMEIEDKDYCASIADPTDKGFLKHSEGVENGRPYVDTSVFGIRVWGLYRRAEYVNEELGCRLRNRLHFVEDYDRFPNEVAEAMEEGLKKSSF